MNSIQTENLSIAYEENIVVSDMNMTVPEGKITSIIGPNGCGKSTVLKTVGRVMKPKSGVISLNGKDISTMPTGEVARRMAILPQSPQAPAGLTVAELVAYGRFPHQKGFGRLNIEDREIIKWALSVTKLQDFKDAFVDSMSGGQRQRVWIAMALAQQTDLILLDEPTTYLDLSYQLEVLELLHSLNREQGCTVAMVLHDLNLASRFSDHMIAVRDGRIVCHGKPEEVMVPAVLKETFRIKAEVGKDPLSGRPLCVSYDLIREDNYGDNQ